MRTFGLHHLITGALLIGSTGCGCLGAPVDVSCGEAKSAAIAAMTDADLRLSPTERGLARTGESLVIPAAAHADGAQGTTWRTDVVLTAVGRSPARVRLELLERGRANPDPRGIDLEIPGGTVTVLDDVLATAFGVEGAAALRIHCLEGTLGATSRTYNLQGSDPLNSPTFGQFLPALSMDDAILSGDQGRLLQLAHDPTLAQGQRTNLLLVNGGDRPTTVSVALGDDTGASLGEITETLEAWEYRQLDKVFERVTGVAVPGGYAAVEVTTAGGRIFALASVVDNLTGDPVAVPSVLRSSRESTNLTETQLVPAVARVSGFADTDWSTDLVLHGLVGPVASAQVTLLPRDQENTEPESVFIQLPEGQSLRAQDVLAELFETDGAAALWVTTYGGGMAVTSRTFNRLGEGNAAGLPAGATFGQYMGPIPFTRAFRSGDQAWITHLSHDPSLATGSRSNLGLVSGSLDDIDIEVALYRGDGTHLGSFVETLRQWENIQINRVFERVTSTPVDSGYAVVRTLSSNGRFWAYGSVVDNRTGDPITIDAIGVRRPLPAGAIASADMAFRLFEAGLEVERVFDLLHGQGLGTMFDVLALARPDVATRTEAGIIYDLGSGVPLGESVFAGGRLEIEDLTVADGDRLTGTVHLGFDGAGIDGRAPVVDDLELGLDLARVDGNGVAGTVTLGLPGRAKSADGLAGEVQFDTRVCELYPVGGEIRVSVAGEERIIRFSDRCDGGFEAVIPSSGHYELNLPATSCSGDQLPQSLVAHLMTEDGEVVVDPSSSPGTTGRRRWSTAGSVNPSEAAVRYVGREGTGPLGDRRRGSFQGQRQTHGGELIYYTGTYGGTVVGDGCSAGRYDGRDDPDFVPGLLTVCDGPCGERKK
jgi:hypothetical protein